MNTNTIPTTTPLQPKKDSRWLLWGLIGFTVILLATAVILFFQLKKPAPAPTPKPKTAPQTVPVQQQQTEGVCTLSFTVGITQDITVECSQTGTTATVNWTAVSGATKYLLRVDYKDNNTSSCTDGWFCSDPPDKMLNDLLTNSTSVNLVPNKSYKLWIHYVDQAGNESSPAYKDNVICNGSSPVPSPSASPSPNPSASPSLTACFDTCDNDSECASGLRCMTISSQKRCVNPACTEDTDCSCASPVPSASPAASASPGASVQPQPSASPRLLAAASPPQALPKAGANTPLVLGVSAGILMMLLGLLF